MTASESPSLPQRDELRALAEAATPGPWMQGMAGNKPLPEVDNRFHFGMVVLTETGTDDADGGVSTAAYIAAASPDRILALLDDLDALAARRDDLAEKVAAIPTHNGTPVTPENLEWAATHEALCRSWIFDVLTGLAALTSDRAATEGES